MREGESKLRFRWLSLSGRLCVGAGTMVAPKVVLFAMAAEAVCMEVRGSVWCVGGIDQSGRESCRAIEK